MGLYDYVLVPCPKCGNQIEGQTKGGDCAKLKLNISKLTLSEAECMIFIPCSQCGCEALIDLDRFGFYFDFTKRVKIKETK